MTSAEIRDTLIRDIYEIQQLSGRPYQEITDDTVPLHDLCDFDSLNAEEVTVRVAVLLNIDVQHHTRLFADGRHPISIRQIVTRLCEHTEHEGSE